MHNFVLFWSSPLAILELLIFRSEVIGQISTVDKLCRFKLGLYNFFSEQLSMQEVIGKILTLHFRQIFRFVWFWSSPIIIMSPAILHNICSVRSIDKIITINSTVNFKFVCMTLFAIILSISCISPIQFRYSFNCRYLGTFSR